MRKIVKRIAAAASAVVIGGVSCVTTWFSVPASAAGGFGWLEWAEFQSLLQGVGFSSGGGGYKNVQEATLDWLNMTSDQFYKLTDPTDGGNAKPIWEQSWWGDMTDWLDNVVHSWSEDYSGIADVGADVSGSDFVYDGLETYNGFFRFSKPLQFISKSYPDLKNGMFFSPSSATPYVVLVSVADSSLSPPYRVYQIAYFSSSKKWDDTLFSSNYMHLGTSGSCWTYATFYPSLWEIPQQFSNGQKCWSMSDAQNFLDTIGIDGSVVYDSIDHAVDFLNSCVPDWKPGTTGTDGFVGPVYTYPAAQDLYKSTGTAAGVRLDVQTQDGVPDLQAALDGAGVDTVDDLVAGVAAGTVPMSKVFSDAKVTPYVVADTTAGTVVTDLGVSATATGVKAVGLTQDLAVPKDLTNAATYVIKGKTWDPEMSKYKLPLFQYFPFCLPWDIYQVLAAFSADPVAPVFDVPVGKILSGVRSADVSKAASLSAKIDFGDDNWSKVFEVIRILECAGIIVGLCLVAVYLIHGGR